MGACFSALYALLAHDLGWKPALPQAHCTLPHCWDFCVTNLVILFILSEYIETAPSVEMTLCFYFPQVGAQMLGEQPATPMCETDVSSFSRP